MSDKENARLILEAIPPTMRAIRSEMRRMAGSEFTVPQFRVLARLSRQSGSNGELAEWMGVTAPTMSRMINNLVKRGYATRKVECQDRRHVTLACTPKGLQRAQKIRASVQAILSEKLSSLPPQKRRQLTAGLQILKEIFL